jgi:hypothetical protein
MFRTARCERRHDIRSSGRLQTLLQSHSGILRCHHLAVNFCVPCTLRSIKTGSHYDFLSYLAGPMFHGCFLCTPTYPINGLRLTLVPSVAYYRYYKCCLLHLMSVVNEQGVYECQWNLARFYIWQETGYSN